jgi:hypothetical protein
LEFWNQGLENRLTARERKIALQDIEITSLAQIKSLVHKEEESNS